MSTYNLKVCFLQHTKNQHETKPCTVEVSNSCPVELKKNFP